MVNIVLLGEMFPILASLVISLETTVHMPWYLDNMSVEEPGRSIVPVKLVINSFEGGMEMAKLISNDSGSDILGSITVDRLGSLFGLWSIACMSVVA